jgi:haloalkane dehalogenase
MPDAIRTPEERFADLPEFPFAPRYTQQDGLRLAHIDEGDGPPVVLLHGEPTWSFLWRKVIGPLVEAGHRCLAPDLPGFGRSDKPTDIGWYSYDRHTAAIADWLEELDVRDATLVVHDWGSPIGLRVAVEQPDRIGRMVLLDGGVFTGRQPMSDAWIAFRDFVMHTEDLPIGMLVRRACHRDPGDVVAAAYEAPFPTPASKAGARAFPLIMPTTPDEPGAREGQHVIRALREDPRPKLFMWADSDPILPVSTGEKFAAALGGSLTHVIHDAGHFLQEDAGPEIGARIVEWLDSLPAEDHG